MLHFFIRLFFPEYQGTHHKTVRYAFSFVFLFTIFAGIAAVIAQDVSYISISTTNEVVAKDQEFVIDVDAFAHVPINAVDVVLSYPEDSMVIDSIDTGTSVITLWTEEPYAENGKIYLRGGTFRKGFIGEHTIARIRAHATEAGSARIVLQSTQLVAGDGKGTEIAATKTDGSSVVLSVTGSDGVLKAQAEIGVVTDIDGDGSVSLADVSSFMAAWLTRSHTFDFDGDGRMTFKDFSILLADSFRR
jgi:hypothetical protein